MKLLITSVGSLVGKAILDVLEFPGLSRRSLVRVIGTNSVADAANNFRCDRCYLVPESVTAEYHARIRAILVDESPDLILCGRDQDTLTLSQLKAQHPGLPGALPVGEPRAALIGLDKFETWQFTRRHGLPFAETFMPGKSGDGAALEAFCQQVGYPLVAKPVRGFASRGVYFVRDAHDVQLIAQREGYLLQEYLGDPLRLEPYFASLHGLTPLFAQAPDTDHYSCQTVIAPNGDCAPILIAYYHREYGKAVLARRISDSSLDALTAAYARAWASEGARGPVNFQFRRDRHGNWKVQEINLRNTGTMCARFLLGMDELYLIVRDFVPGVSFPEMHPAENERSDHVSKHLSTFLVPDTAIATLTGTGVWSRSDARYGQTSD